jgi:hypothetical protein
MFTLSSTGTGISSIARRNKNPSRMLPVISAMTPTTNGPRNEADLSVSAKREKKDDSCPGGMSSA